MKKIMFSNRFGLTQSVLDGRKKQTRRIVKKKCINYYYKLLCAYEAGYIDSMHDRIEEFLLAYSTYKVGEVVAVAMSYKDIYERVGGWEYVEEYRREHESLAGWNNKMFTNTKMPFAKIEITNVRAQRLQDITDDECLMEGIEEEERTDGEYNYIFFDVKRDLYIRERTPRDAYARLIDAVVGKGTWDSDPYVYVYDFKLTK